MNSALDWQSKIARETTLSSDNEKPCISLINSQSILEVFGPDAEKFLQGQCSADMTGLTEQHSLAGCICTVKGRVLCTFIATKIDDRILLKMNAGLVTLMRECLSKYAAFFRVELIEWPTPCILEVSGNHPKFQTKTIPLTYNLNEKGFTGHLIEQDSLSQITKEINNLGSELISEEGWSDQQIDCGWLNLTENTTEKYLPHQLNLERLNAISFTKGCYTGQEIIARIEYRGKPKRRMRLIELEGLNQVVLNLPTDIIDKNSDKTLGILLATSSSQQKGLAILPVENQGTSLVKIEGIETKLNLLKQPYPMEKL